MKWLTGDNQQSLSAPLYLSASVFLSLFLPFLFLSLQNIIAEHEIRNISCAAQDPEDLSTFAYITKDLKSSHHYCHVFTAFDVVSTDTVSVCLKANIIFIVPIISLCILTAVFLPSTSCQNLAYEIILTLGQAFEVAYQLALQARKSGHGSSTLPESFDSKPSKPVPKPRVNIRKSVSIAVAQPATLLFERKIHPKLKFTSATFW